MTGEVVVIGGGLAGIAAAVRLADRAPADGRRRIRLLERRSRLGGVAASLDHDGLIADTGQHVFLRCYSEYRRLLARLEVEAAEATETGPGRQVELQDRLEITVLLRGGRRARLRRGRWPAPWHLLPALARYAGLAPLERATAIPAAAALSRLDLDDPTVDAKTFGDWLRANHQSPQAIRRLWGLVSVAALNLDPDDASLALAARVFRTGLLDGRDNGDIGLAQVPLDRLHGTGASRLLERLGVTVDTRRRVNRVEPIGPAGPGFVLRTSAGDLLADEVVIATAHGPAARLVPPAACPDAERWGLLGTSAIVNTHLVLDRQVLDVPFAAAPDTTLQWVFDRTRAAGLDGGQYLVASTSAAGPLAAVPGRELVGRHWAELRDLLPGSRQACLVDAFVTREPRATFRQSGGSGALRPATRTRLPGLVLAGAWTATGWPDTMEGAVRSGLAAADALCDQTLCDETLCDQTLCDETHRDETQRDETQRDETLRHDPPRHPGKTTLRPARGARTLDPTSAGGDASW